MAGGEKMGKMVVGGIEEMGFERGYMESVGGFQAKGGWGEKKGLRGKK